MITNRRKLEIGLRTFSLLTIIFVFCFTIFISMIGKTDSIKLQPDTMVEVSEKWILDNTNTVSLPSNITIKGDSPTILSCTLPDKVYDTDAIFYDAQFFSQKVYVDDELIYSFAKEPVVPFGHMIGSTYVIAPLKEEYAGKELRIEIESTFGENITEFKNIYIGSAGSFKYYILSTNVWRLLVAVGFFILSITMFFIGIMHLKTADARYNGFAFIYFSLMTSSVSAWILSDSSVVQIFSNKTMLGQLIAYTSLIGVACFYMGLCSCLVMDTIKVFMTAEFVGYFLWIIMIILYVTDILDPVFFMPVIGIYMMFCLTFSFVKLIQNYKKNYYTRLMAFGNAILLIGVSIAMLQYYYDPAGSNIVMPITISFGSFIVLLFIILMNYERRMVKKSSETKIYEKLAYTDQLTGIGNRASFEHIIDEIEARNDIKKVIFFIGDLNYLKKTNDTLGHEMGDALIKAAALCFDEVFNKSHYAFRLGGDEFAAIVVNPRHDAKHYYNKINRAMEKISREKRIELSIAISHSECDYAVDAKDIRRELYREADAKMYDVKNSMKTNKR